MVYYDESQLKVLHDYFNSLDAEKTGTIGSSQLQELFISLGIAQSSLEVEQVIRDCTKDRPLSHPRFDFQQFLRLLKDASVKS